MKNRLVTSKWSLASSIRKRRIRTGRGRDDGDLAHQDSGFWGDDAVQHSHHPRVVHEVVDFRDLEDLLDDTTWSDEASISALQFRRCKSETA